MPWPSAPLSQILTPISRPVSVLPGRTYRLLGAHWYAEGLYIKEEKDGSEIQATTLYKVEPGDFVYNRLFAWKGAFAVAAEAERDCFVSNEFPCFRVKSGLADPRWIHLYFSREKVWSEVLDLSTGGTPTSRNRLKEDHLLAMPIPLPSLPEQLRIVVRVTELATRITEAGRLRQKALAEGDSLLTAGLWRIERDLARFARTLGDAVLSLKNGISRRPDGLEEGPIVLRLADLAGGEVNVSSPRRGSLSIQEVADYDLMAGDLLFLRVNGSRHLVGRCVPFRGSTEPLCFNDHLIRARVDPKVVDWRFVAFLSNGPSARAHFEAKAITTAGQLTVNHSIISAMPLPIPPLSTQERIVEEIEGLRSLQARLSCEQAGTGAELAALLPAVLQKALAGAL